MRWKITGQILGLLLIILPVMYLSLFVFTVLLFGAWSNLRGPAGPLYARASTIALEFDSKLRWQDDQFQIAPQDMRELRALGGWVQVLDESGTEVYQQDKPASAPTHYTPAELILNYRFSGAIKDAHRGYTLFVVMADRGERHFSYIIGFPDTEVVRSFLSVNPRTFYLDIIKVLGGAMLIVTLVIILLAYLYGLRLARPLAEIIDGIQRLAGADYAARYPETGLYASVYFSLNKLARALRVHESERQRLESAREEWIANISHDVKTPLSSLRGYAELLADPDYHFDETEVRQYARTMQDKSLYMESLVEDLRLTYQLKNAALPLRKKSYDLVALLREAVIELLNDPAFSEAPLRFEPQSEKVWFDGDRRLLQRAFTNLILNALVHNPPGTPVAVTVVEIASTDGSSICVTIQDGGKGILPEEVERLFERYYRGTNTGEAYKGSGLGMAIAQQVIQAHGGALKVISPAAPGVSPGGTRIEIRF